MESMGKHQSRVVAQFLLYYFPLYFICILGVSDYIRRFI